MWQEVLVASTSSCFNLLGCRKGTFFLNNMEANSYIADSAPRVFFIFLNINKFAKLTPTPCLDYIFARVLDHFTFCYPESFRLWLCLHLPRLFWKKQVMGEIVPQIPPERSWKDQVVANSGQNEHKYNVCRDSYCMCMCIYFSEDTVNHSRFAVRKSLSSARISRTNSWQGAKCKDIYCIVSYHV